SPEREQGQDGRRGNGAHPQGRSICGGQTARRFLDAERGPRGAREAGGEKAPGWTLRAVSRPSRRLTPAPGWSAAVPGDEKRLKNFYRTIHRNWHGQTRAAIAKRSRRQAGFADGAVRCV